MAGAQGRADRGLRDVAAARQASGDRCRCNGAIQTAPGPLRLIKGGRYSIDFAVALEIDKRINHMPLDRQRRQMEREGLVITTQAMWDQDDALAVLFEPSYIKLLEYILGSDVIGADETYWRLMMKGSTKKWWMWCLTTHDAAWYMLEPSRSTKTISGVLGDFEGIVMCDAYVGYECLARQPRMPGYASPSDECVAGPMRCLGLAPASRSRLSTLQPSPPRWKRAEQFARHSPYSPERTLTNVASVPSKSSILSPA